MHKKGTPLSMQKNPNYADVSGEVIHYLKERAVFARNSGVKHIILDPGIGFGKRTEDNLRLMREFASIAALGYPTVAALSRKTVIGDITGRPVEDRLAGTIAANAFLLQRGANILRVHDVSAARDLVRVYQACRIFTEYSELPAKPQQALTQIFRS